MLLLQALSSSSFFTAMLKRFLCSGSWFASIQFFSFEEPTLKKTIWTHDRKLPELQQRAWTKSFLATPSFSSNISLLGNHTLCCNSGSFLSSVHIVFFKVGSFQTSSFQGQSFSIRLEISLVALLWTNSFALSNLSSMRYGFYVWSAYSRCSLVNCL